MKRRERRGVLELNFRWLDSLPKGENPGVNLRIWDCKERNEQVKRSGKRVRLTMK
jgi:hypothetical protein